MAPYEAYKVEWERTAGDWRDITSYVEHLELVLVRASGSDTSEPSTGTLTLNNADHRFTPGNTTSPEYPYWRQARRVRCRETIGNRSFDTCLMWTQPPEIEDWVASGDQSITVPLVDGLGRLDTARTFVSTMTEHILHNGGSALKAYYPMGDGRARFANQSAYTQPDLVPTIVGDDRSGYFPTTGENKVTPQGGPTLPADETQPASYTTKSLDIGVGLTTGGYVTSEATVAVPMSASQVLTVVAWVYPTTNTTRTGHRPFLVKCNDTGGGGGTTNIYLQNNDAGTSFNPGIFECNLSGSSLTSTILGGTWAANTGPFPVAARYGFNPSLFELWVGGRVLTGTVTGSAPTSSQLTYLAIPESNWSGSIAHAQVYIGAASDFTHDMYLEQVDVGLNGMARQRVDERIRTLLRYAGLTDADLLLDVGVAVMGQASLAGNRPGTLVRAAADTERGRLFVDGAGRVVFHNRTRTYNV